MRKIDTEAYNKRLHTEIMELDKMIKSINPENVNQFDAGLIETADKYIRLISDTTWADNSNFNGIEMHKVKDLIGKIKNTMPKLFVGREILVLDRSAEINFKVNHKITAPETFDARNSFVVPMITDYDDATVFNKKLESSIAKYGERKYIIYKNQKDLTINFEITIPNNGEYYQKLCLTFLYMFWK